MKRIVIKQFFSRNYTIVSIEFHFHLFDSYTLMILLILIWHFTAPNERHIRGIKFPVLGCSSQLLNLPANTTVLFRQCMPHQGMYYKSTNLRIFTYIQCRLLRDPVKETSTVRILIDEDQWMSTKKMEAKGVILPSDRSNLKTEVKKYKRL